jgi:acetolactate synthase I/II/III large subunit
LSGGQRSPENGAAAIARTLGELGVRRLFGIPGVHTLPLYDALLDHPGLTPFVFRHEAGATFAADAYARVSGTPAVVSMVPGPGALNAATGVLCAWSDRVPMVVITTEIDESVRRAAVHECDLLAAYGPFTRGQHRVTNPADIEPALRHALTEAAAVVRRHAHPGLSAVRDHDAQLERRPARPHGGWTPTLWRCGRTIPPARSW